MHCTYSFANCLNEIVPETKTSLECKLHPRNELGSLPIIQNRTLIQKAPTKLAAAIAPSIAPALFFTASTTSSSRSTSLFEALLATTSFKLRHLLVEMPGRWTGRPALCAPIACIISVETKGNFKIVTKEQLLRL